MYEELLATFPRAFADHGAEFFSGIGDDERALELLELNLGGRTTPDAYGAYIELANDMGATEEACAKADERRNESWWPLLNEAPSEPACP